MIIDVYSCFAWVKLMKVKSANNVYNKVVSILNEEYLRYGNSAPKLIQTDEGTEFALVKKKW